MIDVATFSYVSTCGTGLSEVPPCIESEVQNSDNFAYGLLGTVVILLLFICFWLSLWLANLQNQVDELRRKPPQ